MRAGAPLLWAPTAGPPGRMAGRRQELMRIVVVFGPQGEWRKMSTESEDYNARLFSGGLRGRLHQARFHFLAEVTRDVPKDTIFEIGCFDGKSITHLPKRPIEYVGADAGWEGGLAQARRLWPQYEF